MLNIEDHLARLVQELRKRTGLTQERLASRLGVTSLTIHRWENALVRPSPLALRQIESLVRDLGPETQDLLLEFFPEEASN